MAPFDCARVLFTRAQLLPYLHPSALALPTTTSAAPSSPSAAVFSTRW